MAMPCFGRMEGMKRIRAALLCIMLMLLTTAFAATVPAAAPAGTGGHRNELVKVRIKGSSPADYHIYYYDRNGKRVKNTWKKLTVNGKTRRLYFGSSGKALKAKADSIFKYNVAVKTVQGKKYGFDANGCLLTGLTMSAGFGTGRFYYFNKDGTLNASVTKAFQNAAEKGADSAALRKLVKQYAGKPGHTYTTSVCTEIDGVVPLQAVVMQYKSFEVQYFSMPGDKEIVYMATGAMRA